MAFINPCENIDVHDPHVHIVKRDDKEVIYNCAGHTESALERMMLYKEILDNGGTLSLSQKKDLEAISDYMVTMLQAFITAVSEALAPAIEIIAKTAKQLWDSLTPELQEYLTKPARITLNDVATLPEPYSPAARSTFVPPYDSEARSAQHYPGRGGW
ncbi:hypothetical protein SEA_NEFERTHENA_60 [Microbacterium phage Neferthena]|uniref:Uncharacterized protein n=1 Tax=Microbacterium phage Neferthena TaxID=2301539 RepID=A0A385D3G3_9CAUD|nr:hypothetical protein HOT92_gp42 [Microbacterium phage Neferthena]AXQ52923.1 hypothetical protein SEA_NEFERTHENA_60 [Microbacterium phage Neferthena]